MEFISEALYQYIESHSDQEPELLQRLNRQTHLRILYPRMISGHHQGRLLSMISQIVRPKNILEVGTFTGYSCICLAEGLAPGGQITTIELNHELEAFIRPWLEEAGIADRVNLRFGRAQEIVASLDGPFDLVFIDADKGAYLDYYQMILPKLKVGGLILADNTLWSGKVLDDGATSKETLGVQAFNDFVAVDKRVEKVMLPVRDGLTIIRKK